MMAAAGHCPVPVRVAFRSRLSSSQPGTGAAGDVREPAGGEAIALTREDVDLEARTASGQVPAGGVKCLAALVGYIDMSRSRSPLG
jgi:hypothetical protein